MPNVTNVKVLSTIYNSFNVEKGLTLKEKLLLKNSLLVGSSQEVRLHFAPFGDSAYTYQKNKEDFRVVLGGKLITQTSGLPINVTSKEELVSCFPGIIKCFFGFDYHEMGHVKYTDMTTPLITEYPDPSYRNFLHSLFNTTEDPVIEINIKILFSQIFRYETNPKVYFDYLAERIFAPQAQNYVDRGGADSFLQYLLLLLRCGKARINGTCTAYENHKEELVPRIKEVLYTADPTNRLRENIALGEWIIKNIPEINWENSSSQKNNLSGSIENPIFSPEKSPQSNELENSSQQIFGEGENGEGKGEGEKTAGEEKKESGTSSSALAVAPGGGGFGGSGDEPSKNENDPPEQIPDDSVITEIFMDGEEKEEEHLWIVAKDEYDYDDEVIDCINSRLEDMNDCSLECSRFLNLFKERKRPKYVSGYNYGKLDTRRAMEDDVKNGCDPNLFKRLQPRGKKVDLAVSVLFDNSGSMDRNCKSSLCLDGVLAIAQACDWSGIPFECNCFTEEGRYCGEDTYFRAAYTTVVKSFEDSFEKAKPYFGICDSHLCLCIHSPSNFFPSFACNVEEINLKHIKEKLRKVKHERKLLFVLCDGMTCGSGYLLKETVESLENDGIVVVGIGIMSDLSSCYSLSKTFSSTEEMKEDLPRYLVDTLSQYATR